MDTDTGYGYESLKLADTDTGYGYGYSRADTGYREGYRQDTEKDALASEVVIGENKRLSYGFLVLLVEWQAWLAMLDRTPVLSFTVQLK